MQHNIGDMDPTVVGIKDNILVSKQIHLVEIY